MCIANVEHISLTQLNFYKDLSDLSKKESNKYVQTSQISNELHWMLLANERNPPKAPNMYFFFKAF